MGVVVADQVAVLRRDLLGLEIVEGAFSGGGELGIVGLDGGVGFVGLAEDLLGGGGGAEGVYLSGDLFGFAVGGDGFFVVDLDVFAGAAEGVPGIVIAGSGGGVQVGGPGAALFLATAAGLSGLPAPLLLAGLLAALTGTGLLLTAAILALATGLLA